MSQADVELVISGAAMISPLGLTRQETWQRVRAGECGMKPLSAMETPLPPDRLGGQAPDLPADCEPGRPRVVRYLRRTLLGAFADAGLDLAALPHPPHRIGLLLGTTLHGMRSGGAFLRSDDVRRLQDFSAAAVLRDAAAGFPIAGLTATTCSACSSSLGSIALAATLLRSGELDLVIAGGYDPISEYAYAGFSSLRLVSGPPLRPFTRGREGMKLAEGYAVVILERASQAAARTRPLAVLAGHGESADAHHLTQPHPEGEGAAAAMAGALRMAGLEPGGIDLIVAHATGTPDNDRSEHAALARQFGDRLPGIPVVAFKSHLGHTLGAAGAVELILAAMAMGEGTLPPCANVQPQEIEYPDLRLTHGQAHPASIRAALSTSLGFGGANTCAIVTPYTPAAARLTSASTQREVVITGASLLAPGISDVESLRHRLLDPSFLTADTGAIPEDALAPLINARRARRLSEYVKLLLAATTLCLRDAGLTESPALLAETSVLLGTMHGSTAYSVDYYGQIVREGLAAANPMLFAEGVPNAGSAHLSLAFGIRGACQTLIGPRNSGLDAMRLAALRIASGECDRAIVGAAEEYSPICNRAYASCGLYAGRGEARPLLESGFLSGAGAAIFVLESRAAAEARSASPRATFVGGAGRRFAPADAPRGIAEMLQSLPRSDAVLSSANGTWVGRAELAAVRHVAAAHRSPAAGHPALVSSIYGHLADSAAVSPLAGLAATLLLGRLPALRGDAPLGEGLQAATDQRTEVVNVLATDYTGLATAAQVKLTAAR